MTVADVIVAFAVIVLVACLVDGYRMRARGRTLVRRILDERKDRR